MTQYLRGQQAYAATTSAIAQTASSEIQNLSYMNKRLQQAITPSPGTTAYSQSYTVSSTQRWLELSDPLWASFQAAGYVPAAGDTSQNTSPGTISLNSNSVNMYNPGVHRQVLCFWGDSITASDIGGGTYPLMSTQAVYFFMQPIVQMGVPYIYKLSSDTQGPNICYTCSSLTSNRSRISYNFGQDSCRASNVPAGSWGAGYTYVQGSPWADACYNFASSLYVFPNQQLVHVIWLGTNDINYADANGNGGLGSVPVGTPGYTYAQAPNYIQQSLIPLLTQLRLINPNAKYLWIGSIERGGSVSEDGKFVEIVRYVKANQTALGIDLVIDSTTFPKYTPTVLTNSANRTYYQSDSTHMTPAGYIDKVYGIPARVLAALDQLLGY